MKLLNFGERLAFGVVESSIHPSTLSIVHEKYNMRLKEGFQMGVGLVPELFSSTIICGEGSIKRKNYRTDIRYGVGNKPRLFSETCFVTPKRTDSSFKSEVKPTPAKQRAVNQWFSSSVQLIAREYNYPFKSIQIDQPMQSAKIVLSSGPETFFAESSVIDKDCDYNQNVSNRYDTRR